MRQLQEDASRLTASSQGGDAECRPAPCSRTAWTKGRGLLAFPCPSIAMVNRFQEGSGMARSTFLRPTVFLHWKNMAELRETPHPPYPSHSRQAPGGKRNGNECFFFTCHQGPPSSMDRKDAVHPVVPCDGKCQYGAVPLLPTCCPPIPLAWLVWGGDASGAPPGLMP